MTSTMPSGTPGNSRSRPRAYEMMIGSAMRKPRIQPGRGSATADSMMDGRTKRDGDLALPLLDQRPFAQRLGEGVGVGPAEREGAGGAGPTSSSLTHSSRTFSARAAMRWSPAAPISARAFLVKSFRLVGLARLGLQVVAQPAGDGDLVLPRHVEREAVLAEQLLLGLALVRAGHVGGGDGDEVAGRPGVGHGGGDPGGAEQVDLDGLGQGRVEGDGGGGVDDDVGPAQRVPPCFVESESVAPDVAGHGLDPPATSSAKSSPSSGAGGRSSRS